MFSKMTILASFAVAAGMAGAAHADGVDFEPVGVGGVRWTVSVAGFSTPLGYGARTAQAYSVPYAAGARGGCFVVSPNIPVTHANGWGSVSPDIYSTWEAVINKHDAPARTVFTLRAEVQGAGGGAPAVFNLAVTSGLYNSFPIYFPTPDTTLFWGDLDSNGSISQGFPVHTGDTVRVSICDLAAESTIDVRHLIIQTLPADGQP